MTIALTGATGFVGLPMLQTLSEREMTVKVLVQHLARSVERRDCATLTQSERDDDLRSRDTTPVLREL